ncbi:MAG: HAD family hydrolase [Eubacteriales bacterium]
MKTLYISDLDGTLLNKSAVISDFTVNALNRLIENGLIFGVATARTATTSLQMLSEIHLNAPVITMNGASIYDMQKRKYILAHFIEKSSVQKLFSVLKKHDTTGFVFIIENDTLSTYYERIFSDYTRRYMEERIKKYGKLFMQINDFAALEEKPVVYFSVCDFKEKLIPVYEELCKDKNLHVEFYRDVYEDGYWYLETCSVNASKYNAVMFLREEFGFDKVVSFGDNVNDLPMFEASDECYAVANALPAVKEKATAVIESNDTDGVVKWLMKRFE